MTGFATVLLTIWVTIMPHSVLTWYHAPGGTMADGEQFSVNAATVACPRYLGLGTVVRICHGERCVVATCADRTALWADGIYDGSSAVFAALAPLERGVLDVTVELQMDLPGR